MAEHNISLARPVPGGKLLDPGREGRIRGIVHGLIERVESVESGWARFNAFVAATEKRLDDLEALAHPIEENIPIYKAVSRGKGKWGVDDIGGEAIEEMPLAKDVAHWLAVELNRVGPDIRHDQYEIIMTQAKRRSEKAA